MRAGPPLDEVYGELFDALGPQHWWPGEGACEIAVGAILVQNTNWRNVERAMGNLKRERILSWSRLREVSEEELADWIRPAGTYRVKARRLKAFVEMLWSECEGSLDALFARGVEPARRALLQVNGIGPETADCILLYAGGFPVFVIDAYTRRILFRHGWATPDASYAELAALCSANIAVDSALYNEFHALMVQVGKTWCRPEPRCGDCPLKHRLPPGGPLA